MSYREFSCSGRMVAIAPNAPPTQSNQVPYARPAVHSGLSIPDAELAQMAQIASYSARDLEAPQAYCSRPATTSSKGKDQRQVSTAYPRPKSSQGKEINKQDGACIARGPVPVSALRFLPGKVVASGEGNGFA